MFRFIHAADIHLDSPLRGLERYDGAPAEQIRQATRLAFQNLIQLAVEQQVAFVLIAGDVYDGDWKDFNTGLFFTAQMVRLRDAGIQVYLIAGNHDAASRITKSLKLPDNVRMLSHRGPETICNDHCGVAIHGQSFATAAVTDDLSAEYPRATRGMFNIGLLHTCATGRAGHESYAPCSLDGLRSLQYDYWALGHIHQREVLHNDPPIIFAGNLQGRHIREAGPKGCTLVTVDDAGQTHLQHLSLDVVRWELCQVDASQAESGDEILNRFSERLRELLDGTDDRPLMARVLITGACPAHGKVAGNIPQWSNEIRARAIEVGSDRVWIERVKLNTSLPVHELVDTTAGSVGELMQYISELESDPGLLAEFEADFADLMKKLPAELRDGPDSINLASSTLREMVGQVRPLLLSRLVLAEEQA